MTCQEAIYNWYHWHFMAVKIYHVHANPPKNISIPLPPKKLTKDLRKLKSYWKLLKFHHYRKRLMKTHNMIQYRKFKWKSIFVVPARKNKCIPRSFAIRWNKWRHLGHILFNRFCSHVWLRNTHNKCLFLKQKGSSSPFVTSINRPDGSGAK